MKEKKLKNHLSKNSYYQSQNSNIKKWMERVHFNHPQKQAKIKALEAEIDQLIYKLYNLTPGEIKIVESEKSK